MAASVRDWLESVGLGKYAEAFDRNDIGLDILPCLTEEHLKEIGACGPTRSHSLAARTRREAPRPLGFGAPSAYGHVLAGLALRMRLTDRS